MQCAAGAYITNGRVFCKYSKKALFKFVSTYKKDIFNHVITYSLIMFYIYSVMLTLLKGYIEEAVDEDKAFQLCQR